MISLMVTIPHCCQPGKNGDFRAMSKYPLLNPVLICLLSWCTLTFAAPSKSHPSISESQPETRSGREINRTGNYLSLSGTQLIDSQGNSVRLTGVNWFGFETSNMLTHGLWTRDYESMLQQISDLGFNCIRLPFCDAMLASETPVNVNTWGPDPYTGAHPMNAELEGATPLEALDIILDRARDMGLKIILDSHSRNADGYMAEELWYTDNISEEEWIANWVMLAERYLDNDAVIGCDINNEPHGQATWGGSPETDWKSAAERCGNAILQVNPNVLIIVEGVEQFQNDYYWWGGNLMGVMNDPVELIYPEKLVYSPHEYGPEVHLQPWFDSFVFPYNMSGIWNTHFGFIMIEDIGHLLMGEFGIGDESYYGGVAGEWFSFLMDYIGPEYSWTYWCMNPNSGDTGGILMDDWVSVHDWKMDYLIPHLDAPIANYSNITSGDVNGDENIDVLDIVLTVDFVLGNAEPTGSQMFAGDINSDGLLDILDIVLMVGLVLNP